MRYFKTWILICFSIFVTFVHSENLPKKLPSNFNLWIKGEEIKSKIGSGEINVLSYNTWGLPISLFGHDQDRRFSAMGDSILSLEADIIGLQETFHPNLRENLLSNLGKSYYTFSDYRCERIIIPGVEMDCTGGLMTFSTFPIIKEQFYPFPINDAYSYIEITGQKGFLVTYIQHGQKMIAVINTHLYAGNNRRAEDIRLQQIKYMHSMMDSFLLKDAYQTIMIGDFNIHHPDVACSDVYDFIEKNMQFRDSKPNIGFEDFTISNSNNYCAKNEFGSKLDYIFIESSSTGKIISQSRVFDSKLPLSDHYGWQVIWQL